VTGPVLAVVMAATLALPAAGQTAGSPESREAARVLVEAMGAQEQVEHLLQQMRGVVVEVLRRRSPGSAVEQVETVVDDVLMPEFQSRRSELVDTAVAAWADRLSVPELRELSAFYETPVVRKFLAMAPEVTEEHARFAQAWGRRVGAEALAKHRDALRARGLAP